MDITIHSHSHNANRLVTVNTNDNTIWLQAYEQPFTINIFLTHDEAIRLGKSLMEIVSRKKEEVKYGQT